MMPWPGAEVVRREPESSRPLDRAPATRHDPPVTDDSNDTSALDESETKRRLRPEEQDPMLWRGEGWTARVIKNEDDDGWAVSMTLEGHDEPALVGPWTMGRDKKNPKPLDAGAFATLVKTASEVLMRHEQQRRAQLHRSVAIDGPDGTRWRVELDIVPDEYEPYAEITVRDGFGEVVRKARVAPTYKLTSANAHEWAVADG